jgi:LPXTG-motif cell wall-anchored protein
MVHPLTRTVAAIALSVSSLMTFSSSAHSAPEQASAVDDTYTGVVIGTAVYYDVDDNDVDATIAAGFGTNSPHCALVSSPKFGTLTPSELQCHYTYVPGPNFPGRDSYVYSIDFDDSNPAQATVTFIGPAAPLPVEPTTTTVTTAAPATTVPTVPTTIATVEAVTSGANVTKPATAGSGIAAVPVVRGVTVTATTVAAKAAPVVEANSALPTTGTDSAMLSLTAAALLVLGMGLVWVNGRRKAAVVKRDVSAQ